MNMFGAWGWMIVSQAVWIVVIVALWRAGSAIRSLAASVEDLARVQRGNASKG